MTDQPLRAAIIGLGIGKSHAKGYAERHGATLVALCDLSELRLAELSAEFDIPADGLFKDYNAMLKEIKPDIVSICLPNALHKDSTLAALEAGAHVLCEKPMATTVVEAEAMMAAARANHRQLMIAYSHRYRPDVWWIRRMIDDGALGEIYHVHAQWRRETGIPGSGWFNNKALAGGGALIDLGVHMLDMALWFMDYPVVNTVSGSVRSVFGPRNIKTWGLLPGQERGDVFNVDDGAVAFLRLGNGASLLLESTWAEHRQPGDDLFRVEIQGSLGTAVLHVANYTRENTLTFYTELSGWPVTVTPKVKLEGTWGHERLIAESIAALRAGTPLPTAGEQGVLAVRVLEAIYQSAAAGHEIVVNHGL